MARILITNNGTHSADKWAVTTAEMIFPLEDTALVGERLIAAQKFQTTLAESLSGHYAALAAKEKAYLSDDAHHFASPLDPSSFVKDAIHDIVGAAKGSPWEQHFAKPEVQDIVHGILANHMQSTQHAERLWYAAHNRSEHGDRYLAAN